MADGMRVVTVKPENGRAARPTLAAHLSSRLPSTVYRLLVVALGVCAAAVVAQTSPPAQQAPDQLEALHREAEALARQERTLLTELRQLELDRTMKVEQLRRTTQELADVNQQRAEAAARVQELDGQISVDRPAVAARLVELYKLGRPGYARLFLDVNGVQSAMRAYRTVSSLIEADRRRVAAFRRTLDELRATERALVERTTRIQKLQAETAQAKAEADSAVAAHNALIARIDARRDLNARLAGELQAAQQKLSGLAPAAPAPPVAAAPVVSLLPLRGSLDWPAAGRVASRFGTQQDSRFGTTTVHAGIEIGAAAGDQARAVQDGVVAYADPFTGFGNLVIVDHGRQSYSLYGYLDTVAVTKGARVTRAQPLGTVGRAPTGNPSLYFELRIDGKAVDPLQWLKKR
jgi:murein hydrolase activator